MRMVNSQGFMVLARSTARVAFSRISAGDLTGDIQIAELIPSPSFTVAGFSRPYFSTRIAISCIVKC